MSESTAASSRAMPATSPDFTACSLTELLCQLISIPSVNPMGRNLSGPEYLETRLSDWLEQFFQALQVPYERIPVAPGRDNLIARYTAPAATGTVLLDAHQDTVPVDGMTIPPFTPTQSNGRIYGRGACDVKGGLAAMLFAFRRLVQEQPLGSANVILTCTCDEEATILGIQDLVRSWQQPLGRSRLLTQPPDAAIIAEPTDLQVVVAHRGVLRFGLHTSGLACHSSNPTEGINAIYRMGRVLTSLEEYSEHLQATSLPHPLCGSPTMSVGRIEGGTSVNIVPEACRIEIDRRLIPGEQPLQAFTHLQRTLQKQFPFPVEMDEPWLIAPALDDAGNPWLAAALLQNLAALNEDSQAVGVPYCTHASHFSAVGVPAVVFGPGSIAQAHTADESIEIASLEKAAEVYFQFCAVPPEFPIEQESTQLTAIS